LTSLRATGDTPAENIFAIHPAEAKHINGNNRRQLRRIGSPMV